jgi:putative DNA primase/helicase
MAHNHKITETPHEGKFDEHPRSPKPIPLVVLPEHVPTELKAMNQWLVWRYFWQKGKWDKPPLQAHGGNLASSTNPKTWSTFEAAMVAYSSRIMDGLGFVLVKTNHLVGIDLDHCRNPETGTIDAWAQAIVDAFDTYTELSPSGTGLHLLVHGTLPGKGLKTAQGEMYDRGRYLTASGHILPGRRPTIASRQEAIDHLYTSLRAQQAGTKMVAEPSSHGTEPSPNVDDQIILNKAYASRNAAKFTRLWSGDTSDYAHQNGDGTPNDGHSEADLALCRLLAFFTQDPQQLDRLFRQSKLYREKWERADYRDGTVTRAIETAQDHWQGVSAVSYHSTQDGDDQGDRLLPLRPYTPYQGYRKGVRYGQG